MPGYELIGKEEKKSLDSIFIESNGCLFAHGFQKMRNNKYQVRAFEKEICKKLNVSNALAVSSGTMAQFVAMKVMGCKPGDEVITQAFTFVATIEVILALGCKPIITECDTSLNMDPKDLEKKISRKTKLIIPVHMLGQAANLDRILEIGKKHGIPVMEDSCEALGGQYKNRYLGTLGDCGIFSLDFAKTITTGEGGIILFKNSSLARRAREYHDHGHKNQQGVPRGLDARSFPGLNFRMTEMQGAVGRAQLKKLKNILTLQRKNKWRLFKNIKNHFPFLKTRHYHDKKGDCCDTLILDLISPSNASAFVKKFTSLGFSTKNIPDALQWHFARKFSNMFDGTAYESSFRKQWNFTNQLLLKSVAIPISCKWNSKDLQAITEAALKSLKAANL